MKRTDDSLQNLWNIKNINFSRNARVAKKRFVVGGTGNSFTLGRNGKLEVFSGEEIEISGEVNITGEFKARIDNNLSCSTLRTDTYYDNPNAREEKLNYIENDFAPENKGSKKDNATSTEYIESIVNIYPNPTESGQDTYIEVFTPKDSELTISISSIEGTHLGFFAQNKPISTGYDRFKIDTKNSNTGIYMLQIKIGSKNVTKKLILSS